MDGTRFREMLQEMLPRPVIEEAVKRLGVQERARKIVPVGMVWSLIFAGGTEECGRLASALRAYTKEESSENVSRGAYYQWFDEESLALLRELARRCCGYVARMPTHLPGILAGCRDWRAVDSTVVKLPPELFPTYPGTGAYASLKVHKVYSLGVENIVDYHITPGRDHDAPALTLSEEWRGMGLVVDLAYASFRLLRECQAFDTHLVIKLKQGWNVSLDGSASEEAVREWLTGCDLQEAIRCGSFEIDPTKELDVDVVVGPAKAPIRMRLVGIPLEEGQLLFLTTLPRTTHSPQQIGTIYRLRWNIELDNKLNKSAFRLDQITARTPVSAEILVHAAMMAAIIANAFAHQDHLDRGFVGEACPKLVEGPLHPMLVAKAIAPSAHHLADMLTDPDTPLARWDHLAAAIRRLSLDPNWRRKPSALDLVKGRHAPPGRPRRQKRSAAPSSTPPPHSGESLK